MERKRGKKEEHSEGSGNEEGKRRKAVERILEMVGAKVDIQEGKKLRSEGDKEGEMVLVKLGNEGQKREVKKSKLRGRKEKIMEDWTWKESKMEEVETGGNS